MADQIKLRCLIFPTRILQAEFDDVKLLLKDIK